MEEEEGEKEEEEEEEEEEEKEMGEKKREEKREEKRKESWEVKDLHLDTTTFYNYSLKEKKKKLLTILLGMSWTMGGWSLTGSMVTVT